MESSYEVAESTQPCRWQVPCKSNAFNFSKNFLFRRHTPTPGDLLRTARHGWTRTYQSYNQPTPNYGVFYGDNKKGDLAAA